jgi:hypothetical protein
MKSFLAPKRRPRGRGGAAAEHYEGDSGQQQEARITHRLFKARLYGGEYRKKKPVIRQNYRPRKDNMTNLAKKTPGKGRRS